VIDSEASGARPQRSIDYGRCRPKSTDNESDTTQQPLRQPREFHTVLVHHDGVEENIGHPVGATVSNGGVSSQQTTFVRPVADVVEHRMSVQQQRSSVNSSGSSSGLSSFVVIDPPLTNSASPYATAGQCVTTVVGCQGQRERDAVHRQSPELSREGQLVYKSMETSTITGVPSTSFGTEYTLVTETGANVRRSVVNRGASAQAVGTMVTGIYRTQNSPVFGVEGQPMPMDIPGMYPYGHAVPTTSTGGHASANLILSHVECITTGADKRVPSPVVPRSRSGEYHSSSTESDSVMNDVQRAKDLNWRNQALHHVNCTTVPCVRQLSNSSSDSIGGIVCSMECTGTTASLQGPRTLQVSQVIPADPRAEGARPSAQEGRGNRYPVELREKGARFSAPPRGTCSRPADLRAGDAHEAAQATCMQGPATSLLKSGMKDACD